MIGTLAAIAVALGTGAASAVIPVINAEAAVTAAALVSSTSLALTIAVAIAVGQTAGKVVLFEAARRAARRRIEHTHSHPEPRRAWQRRALELVSSRWSCNAIVLLSASVGMPPLAITSIAAGAVQSRLIDFVICCLIGRTARFLTVAGGVIWVT